jgi:hypothetical protein
VAFLLVLPMGWKNSHPIFSTATATISNLTYQQINLGDHQLTHPLDREANVVMDPTAGQHRQPPMNRYILSSKEPHHRLLSRYRPQPETTVRYINIHSRCCLARDPITGRVRPLTGTQRRHRPPPEVAASIYQAWNPT